MRQAGMVAEITVRDKTGFNASVLITAGSTNLVVVIKKHLG